MDSGLELSLHVCGQKQFTFILVLTSVSFVEEPNIDLSLLHSSTQYVNNLHPLKMLCVNVFCTLFYIPYLQVILVVLETEPVSCSPPPSSAPSVRYFFDP